MTGKSDSELVELFQQGDETAFNHIVLRYQEKIYWLVRRFVGDHDDANDVVQEVFVKAYEALNGFRRDANVYTWLYRIGVNASLNFIRLRKVKDFFRLDDHNIPESSEQENPNDSLESLEQTKLIEEAIAKLPEKQKAVFLLRYYEELSYEEIAKILKKSVGGLKANYFHAVRKIEEYVKRAYRM